MNDLTAHDTAAVARFRDFLRSAGPPDGHTLSRLEHRPDLIRYVLNLDPDGYPL